MRNVLLFVAGLAAIGVAEAQASPRREPVYADPRPVCVKICPEDYAPCDPDYLKQVDHRCKFERERGGRQR